MKIAKWYKNAIFKTLCIFIDVFRYRRKFKILKIAEKLQKSHDLMFELNQSQVFIC